MTVFSAEWFAQHQAALLWLLNHWITRRWFRWVLCIRRHDIGYDKPILELCPHAYTVLLDDSNSCFSTDFRTHPKYAKRLYYAFRPAWWLLHFFDWLLLDRWVPRLSFGFATLTAYPDPSVNAITCDGLALRTGVNETFDTIRSSAGNSTSETSTTENLGLTASTTTDQFATLARAIFTFFTGAISTYPVVSATLSLFGSSKTTNIGSPDLHIAAATPASDNNFVNADFGQTGSTSFSSISNAAWSSVAYNDFALDANGLANLNVNGISRYSARLSWDINGTFTGTWSSGAQSNFIAFYADQTGTANDPKLVVVYTITGRFAFRNTLRPNPFAPGLAR